jgi:hypothetical protein
VQVSLATGSANVHGGTGYTLLLLAVLVPVGFLMTIVVLPVLLIQYRRAGMELASPLAKPTFVVGILYLIFCAWV